MTRILVVDERFPEHDRNSGDLRMFEILRLMRDQGHAVTFLAKYGNPAQYRADMEALGIACICDDAAGLSRSSARFRAFLERSAFSVAVLCHYDYYRDYAPFLRAFLPNCHLALDTVDIHFLRLRRQAELYPNLRREAERTFAEESRAVRAADSVWVVTSDDGDALRPLQVGIDSPAPILTVPNIHRMASDPPGFAERRGIVFLGGYRHFPNVDAVHWFFDEVFPLLRRRLPDVPVSIVGSSPPPEFAQYAALPGVTVTGFVPDHREPLLTYRVGMAPLRIGAGMKGKVGEYLSCGLPCVSTTIGAEGMGLTDGGDVLVADTAPEFSDALAHLHEDEALWKSLSSAGCQFLRERYTPEALAPILADALAVAAESGAVHICRAPRRLAARLWAQCPRRRCVAVFVRVFVRLGLGKLRRRVMRLGRP